MQFTSDHDKSQPTIISKSYCWSLYELTERFSIYFVFRKSGGDGALRDVSFFGFLVAVGGGNLPIF
jgi:hypothetical protein